MKCFEHLTPQRVNEKRYFYSVVDLNPCCDPNANYNILHETLTKPKDKHLPYKLNTHRHKTINGLLMVL